MPDAPADDPTPITAGPPVTPVPPDTGFTPVPVRPDTGYTPAGVPTLEGVREKIEARFGTALGATELAAETPEARSASERYEERRHAAAAKLEEIRAAMPEGERQ